MYGAEAKPRDDIKVEQGNTLTNLFSACYTPKTHCYITPSFTSLTHYHIPSDFKSLRCDPSPNNNVCRQLYSIITALLICQKVAILEKNFLGWTMN